MRKEAGELARAAKAAMKAAKTLPDAGVKARELEGRADVLKAESEALKGAARLEDLHLWQMEKVKTTKRGSRTYHYWMANWRESGKVRNVHLGSCERMSQAEALQKAKRMKAEALGMADLCE
ncbi:hypothetical protein A7K50_12360 [Dehalobacter sp. MCB1]|nr:hypothetical protein A7K50_12360 [Dehalobacter sp. MCB1]